MWMNLKHVVLVLALALTASVAAAQQQYQVRPGDALSIEVLQDSSLNRTVQVLPDGRINFPLAGTIAAAGRSSAQIEAALSTALADNYASPPTVFVSIQPREREKPAAVGTGTAFSAPEIDIYFLGEVNRPGLVPVAPGTTFLQAIAVGGGLTRFAATKRIQLRRTDPKTRVQNVYNLNYKALSDGGKGQDIELKDGDVILVPERRLFE